ncbi:hypothetical protein Glove_57g119 [Diversispora epigaea]|uniref:Uncharacterized protein n=1 Tax=Diversispora epigaea TaxID=1348612 RepID=A0A397JCB8_9GLOM|nr:hypothetical protein Glove_57g119 [Diversispora epigaea]
MNDMVILFEKITPALNAYYDMKQVKRDLGYLKRIMKKGEWAKLWRRKLVSFEEIKTLENMISKFFKKKDQEMLKYEYNSLSHFVYN